MAAETGTLTVTHTGTLTIGDETFNFSDTKTVTAVTNPYNTIISVGTTEAVILTIAAAKAGATMTGVDFLRIKNNDTVNKCRIRFKDTGAHTYDVEIAAGEWLTVWNNELNVSETAGAWSVFTQWDEVSADFDTAAGELHVFACQV